MRREIGTGLGLVLTTIALGVPLGLAQNVEQVKPPGSASSFDFGGVNVFEHTIPNAEGKSLVAILVTYPPGGKSPPHHHAPSVSSPGTKDRPVRTFSPLQETKSIRPQ
jgi:hypothetical protein